MNVVQHIFFTSPRNDIFSIEVFLLGFQDILNHVCIEFFVFLLFFEGKKDMYLNTKQTKLQNIRRIKCDTRNWTESHAFISYHKSYALCCSV